MSTHQVTRLCVNLDEDYEDARHRFEAAVPVLDQGHLGDLVARKASWADVVADADAAAPLGFFIFWAQDVDPAMSLNGNTTKCCEYLVGNHTIAERMFRIDPTAMLYVPLRVLLFQKIDGPTTLWISRVRCYRASEVMRLRALGWNSTTRFSRSFAAFKHPCRRTGRVAGHLRRRSGDDGCGHRCFG